MSNRDKNPSKARSRVTNGRSLFDMTVNTRTASYRRFRDLVQGYTSALGNKPTLVQEQLIRRLAAHDVILERIEGDLASGAKIDMTQYSTLANASRRALESLGLATASEKLAEPVDPDRFDYSKMTFVSVDKPTPTTVEAEPVEADVA